MHAGIYKIRERATYLYGLMNLEVDQCRKDEKKTLADIAECCFQSCIKYWDILRGEVATYTFPDEDEEVNFFKNIKPLFTSQAEYYTLLYHAEMFKPDEHDRRKLRGF